MSVSRIAQGFLSTLKSFGLALVGLVVLALALLFPRMFGTSQQDKGLGLTGPDVSHADIPYAQSSYGCDSGGGGIPGCDACGSSTGSGSAG